MAIPANRLLVAGAKATNKSRADYINQNETFDFNALLDIPEGLGSYELDLTTDTKELDVNKVYDSIGELSFVNNITSSMRGDLASGTVDVMNKALSPLGQSIGHRNMINLLFKDCPYDGGNLNYLFGLLLGLIPSLANIQNCSNGLISMLMNMFSGDTSPDMIANSIMGMVDNVKDGKGGKFLEDLNLNAPLLQMDGKLLNVNNSIGNIVKKSTLSTSRNPVEAYDTMVENMDFNDTIFNTNTEMSKVATKRNLNRLPNIPNANTTFKVDFGDVISMKSNLTEINLFD